ncbi:immunity 49 family protein [Streptomyces sp. NBC_01232]|uniref:Imm49 family immunity protein n=1 Tax=Streptomyces sp. NBC_01232 TaxID=2903786 RepID=UPI002E150093|nr:immunity 49 family protein [Streptomyces sp. NBC_01232]
MLETWESWLLAMQVHSAVFAATAPDRETVTCKIRQEERHLVTIGPQTCLTADTWLDAFSLAVICREAARLDMLAAVPMRRPSSATRRSGHEKAPGHGE